MDGVAEVHLEELWACASSEALQRTTGLARRTLKAPASIISSATPAGQIVRCSSDPNRLLDGRPIAEECDWGAVETGQARSSDVTDSLSKVAASIGVPIRLLNGRVIGTLCVAETAPRTWAAEDLELLVELATVLARQIELKLEILNREKAEEALGASNARLLAVADRIPGLVFERRKVDAGRSTYTFFGANKAQLPAVRQLMDEGHAGGLTFIHRDDRDVVRAALLRSNLEETDLDLTFRVKDLDRSTRWLRSQSIVRRDTDGAIYWDGIIFDISDLVSAREEAESARAAKDMLLVNVNHELRTPLQAIIGFTDFLQTEQRPERVAGHARNIQFAAESLLVIVNQLLARAAGDSAAASAASRLDLRSFGEACIGMVGSAAAKKRLSTRLGIDADVPGTAVLDAHKLQQALVNLLKNAVKFTDEGGFTLRIARAADGLRFSVIDSGIGIPESKRDRLFERFSRLALDDRATEGSGLGLSITRALVVGMGGRIGVESHVDRGTTFWFEVPTRQDIGRQDSGQQEAGEDEARQGMASDFQMETPVSCAASDLSASQTGARILLADDLDLNRKLIADMLSLEGHIVECVKDGAEAVESASRRHYDLVLMDMIMPVMDGVAATQAIRALPAPACNVPIIALTANAYREHLERCLKAGMDATLTKPMSIDALNAAVTTWIRGRNQAA